MIFRCVFVFLFSNYIIAQPVTRPKLIVGIVVDQMRAEYLYRFQDNYSEDGFKRLIREGFNVKNMQYNYTPTATGPGHASIYTGTTPANHGIVNNDWFSRELRDRVYCAEDNAVNLVGNLKNNDKHFLFGRRSAKNLKTTTITDELKLFSNGRSKVIGISLKDRGAIFPAGHLADGAYWYNPHSGNFITSSYYRNMLPDWLTRFNAAEKADSLLNLTWKPILPIENYTNSLSDDVPFEKIYKGESKSTFPYNLEKIRKENGNFALLTEVPFGNTLLTSLAIETIKNENLGKGKEIDFLSISYSATDYVGHYFGIRSKELEDTYIRLDLEIASLLKTLDVEVGVGNYSLFLTSDHGAGDHPAYLKSVKLPGSSYDPIRIQEDLNNYVSSFFGQADYIAFFDKTQVYFNETQIDKELVINKAVDFLQTVKGVKEVFAPLIELKTAQYSTIDSAFKNSYFPENSGDIILHFYSGWMEKRPYGTNHSNLYTSDTHVPLLWYGSNIRQGESIKAHTITQIAPSLSMLFNIPLPSASDVNPIDELLKN